MIVRFVFCDRCDRRGAQSAHATTWVMNAFRKACSPAAHTAHPRCVLGTSAADVGRRIRLSHHTRFDSDSPEARKSAPPHTHTHKNSTSGPGRAIAYVRVLLRPRLGLSGASSPDLVPDPGIRTKQHSSVAPRKEPNGAARARYATPRSPDLVGALRAPLHETTANNTPRMTAACLQQVCCGRSIQSQSRDRDAPAEAGTPSYTTVRRAAALIRRWPNTTKVRKQHPAATRGAGTMRDKAP